ncbi:MAG: hypothetical protein FK732_04425 [Asgard group archaeon]|nr:hypothetical protein [Asgard group archaeon]
MSSKRNQGILSWIAIILGLGLVGFGLYRYGFGGGSSFDYLFIIFGALLFICGTVLFIMNSKKQKKRSLTRTQPTTRTRQPVSRSHRLSIEEEEVKLDASKIIASKVDYSVENEKCMISKLEIKNDDVILQCPFCSSYFIKKYLVEWVEKNKTCPVCKSILIED